VAVKIRLKRLGKMRAPYYRVVVVDSRAKRDGRVIEEIGKYHPTEDPSYIEIDSDRAQYWLSVGAQPSDPVHKLLRITGDWQKFRGLPGQEGTLKVAPKRAAEQVAAAIEATEAQALKATAAQSAAAAKAKEEAEAAEAKAAAEAEAAAAEAKAAEAEAAATEAADAAAGAPEDTPEAVEAAGDSAPTGSEN
jgi:small subunit ribosomal protein S16